MGVGIVVRLLVLGALVSACTSSTTPEAGQTTGPAVTETTDQPTTTPVPTTEPATTTTEPPDPVLELIDTLTVEQKVGQLLMPVVAGTSAYEVTQSEAAFNQGLAGYDTPAEIVDAYQLGGLMYLGPNVIDASQIGVFSQQLHDLVAQRDGIPLLISADQEGGRVRRIQSGVTEIPSARSFNGDIAAISQAGQTTAEELGAIGINMILAPVADVAAGNQGVIRDRSFSGDPQIAGDAATASSLGIQAGGGLSVVKHWPGHGATTIDSHKSLPEIPATAEVWAERDAAPFAQVFASGVDAVMVGHLAFPELDPSNLPATVSPELVQVLLRETYGFDGVVMTDAMDMGAVKSYDRGEISVLAIEAGIDILLVPPNLKVSRDALLAAVESGRITPERLDKSVERILRAKTKLAD